MKKPSSNSLIKSGILILFNWKNPLIQSLIIVVIDQGKRICDKELYS
jgi:hypothetical protein